MEADQDHDGKISFEEFTKMVENTDVSMSMTLGTVITLNRSSYCARSIAADNTSQTNSREVPQRYPQDELPGVLSETWLLGNESRAELREKDKTHHCIHTACIISHSWSCCFRRRNDRNQLFLASIDSSRDHSRKTS
jgi:hypothetical protein